MSVAETPVWVAAHQLITVDDVSAWIESSKEQPFVTEQVIGRSVQRRPIFKLEIGNRSARSIVFIMARQHPPEVTGAIGMRNFVETICDDSRLAAQFREIYRTVVVPLANPDGVELGHWRHNAQGVDLIIVASHRPGLQDYFLGSTAAKVVRHAKCSVLVIR